MKNVEILLSSHFTGSTSGVPAVNPDSPRASQQARQMARAQSGRDAEAETNVQT